MLWMDLAVVVAAGLVLAAIVSARFSQRFGVPALVMFVGVGMFAGSSGPLGIEFEDDALSYQVGLPLGGLTPRGSTVFEAGDHVYLISGDADRVGIPADFTGRRVDEAPAAEIATDGGADELDAPGNGRPW